MGIGCAHFSLGSQPPGGSLEPWLGASAQTWQGPSRTQQPIFFDYKPSDVILSASSCLPLKTTSNTLLDLPPLSGPSRAAHAIPPLSGLDQPSAERPYLSTDFPSRVECWLCVDGGCSLLFVPVAKRRHHPFRRSSSSTSSREFKPAQQPERQKDINTPHLLLTSLSLVYGPLHSPPHLLSPCCSITPH
jgi:hypothetical protein